MIRCKQCGRWCHPGPNPWAHGFCSGPCEKSYAAKLSEAFRKWWERDRAPAK